jgi:uncharacterized membrane protein
MIVSLEAIFLSTFVMISQNRADAKQQVLADHQWRTVQEEDQQNRELLAQTTQILELIQDLRQERNRTSEPTDRNAARTSLVNSPGSRRRSGRRGRACCTR